MVSEAPPPGLLASLRRLATAALALLELRLELGATELEMALQFALRRLLWTCVALAFGFLALALFTVSALLFAGEAHRLAASLVLGTVYALLALGALRAGRYRAGLAPGLLAGTLGELRRDLAALRGEP